MEPFDVVLGKTNDGNYCCTNIYQADVFLMILPELKKKLNTKAPETMSPMYSNEMFPIAVNFYDENENLLATYKREKNCYSLFKTYSVFITNSYKDANA